MVPNNSAVFPICTVVVALGLIVARTDAADRPLPNVLFLLSDDQRPDTIAALGNPQIKTPHLDELVRRGTSFTRATCAHPLCYPSRAEILTGTTGFKNGTYSQLKLEESVPLWPRVMSAAGYDTWYVGKWHTAGRPSTVGFGESDGLYAGGGGNRDDYLDFRGRPATGYRGWVFQTDDRQRILEKGVGLTPDISGDFADAAIRFLRRKSEKPFFLHVNFTAPHDPRLWPTRYKTMYDPAQMKLPGNFKPEHPFDHGNARGRDEVLLPFPRTENDVRQELAAYYAVISHMDEQIGRIIAVLEETGERENTIIIFSSDHGLALGSHGLVGKQNMYEHTINVPLVMCGKGIPAGKRSATQCYLRDLFPTVCDLASIAPPQGIDGKSLLPVLRGEAQEVHPFIVGYFQDSQRMIRKGEWKLIWYPKIDTLQLFDVATDPLELADLSGEAQHAERIAELRRELIAWLKAQGDPLVAAVAPD